MNKLPNPYMNKIKEDIRTRYLAGSTIKAIALHYEVTPRNIYYHLKVLTPEDKAIHIKNFTLRSMTPKYKNKKRIRVTQGKEDHGTHTRNGKESTAAESSIGLAGFK